MKYDKKQALNIIVATAANYKEKLVDKHFLSISIPTCKVLAIFRKKFDDGFYGKCTYLSKGLQAEKLPVPKELKGFLKV